MKKIFLFFLMLLNLQVQANLFSTSVAQKKAHDAYQSGDFAQAQSGYTQILTQNPYDAQNNYNLGCTLHKQKKFDDAQNYFNRAIESAKPDSKLQEQALFNCGNNFACQKKFDEAIADYKKVLKMNPNNESAKKNLKACEQMKKEQKKQEQQQKQKDKNKDQDKKDQQNQDQQDQQSGDGSDQDDQSSDQKKDQKGNEQKSSKGKSKDQKGDKQEEGKEKQESKQEQADGLEKSKEQKSKDKKTGEKKKEQDADHDTSSKKSTQQQSAKSDKNDKEESDLQKAELNDAFAQEMMGKPGDDNRLEKRSAMLLDKLDDYEKNIQKKLLQMNVTKQGAQKHGQKNW